MPKGYEHLLHKMLKAAVIEKRVVDELPLPEGMSRYAPTGRLGREGLPPAFKHINKVKMEKIIGINKSTRGIPQGGIISPILMNWTLDGLEEAAKIGSDIRGDDNKRYVDPEVLDYFKQFPTLPGVEGLYLKRILSLKIMLQH